MNLREFAALAAGWGRRLGPPVGTPAGSAPVPAAMVSSQTVLSTIGILVLLNFYSKMLGMMYYLTQGSSYI